MARTWHHFETPSGSQAGVMHYTTIPGDLIGGACTCPGKQYAKRKAGGECGHIRDYRAALRLLLRGQHKESPNMRHPAIVAAERAAVPAVGEPADLWR